MASTREIDGAALRAVRPDIVLLAVDAAELLGPSDPDAGETGLAEAIDRLKALWARARAAHGCTLIQQTLLPAALPLMGGNEHRMPTRSPPAPCASMPPCGRRRRRKGVDLLALDDAVLRPASTPGTIRPCGCGPARR